MSQPKMVRWVGPALCMAILVCCTGCPVVSNLPAPGRTTRQQDPEFRREYHLYIPTGYNAQRPIPLVMSCHGTKPFDTARAQLDEWKGLAEQRNFLLVAPELVGTKGDFTPAAPEQIRRQMEDEAAILAIIRTIKAGYSVEPSQVFLTGWSAGGHAVLFTGLRHPDVFRALSARQGNFKPEFVEPCVPFLDRYQPVQITYGALDPLRDQALACIDWLRAHDLDPLAQERTGSHRRDAKPVYDFFADVTRNKPWIQVVAAEDPNDPMRLTFTAKASFEPKVYLWDFGDGTARSPVAAPEHRFEKPGLYSIRVGLWQSDDKHYVRQVSLQIPRVRLGATLPAR